MRSLIFFVTAACDSACRHCFYHGKAGGGELLTPEDTRRFAASLGRIKDLSISGGEPLLRKDLDVLLEPVLRFGKPRSVTFPTGGLHPELVMQAAEMILRHAPSTRLTVALSFDGPPDVHDNVRGRPGAYVTLKKCHDILAPLCESGILRVKLATTLCSLNERHLEEILLCARRDFPQASFHHFEIMRGRPRDQSVKPPDPALLMGKRAKIIRHWKKYTQFYPNAVVNRLALAAKLRLFDLAVDWLRGVDRMPPCRVDETHLVLTETGDVAFCELTKPIGNIREKDLSAILSGDRAQKRKTMIRSGCSCFHSCFTPTNLMRDPAQWLKLPMLLDE